jgi:nucleoside-diphosphate-sugar epimerase
MDAMLRTLRDALPLGKKSMPVVGIPGEVAEVKAVAAGVVGMGGWLPFVAGMAIMGRADAAGECGKARAELGWRPVPYTPAVREYAGRM